MSTTETPPRLLRTELREFVEQVLAGETETTNELLILRARSRYLADEWMREALIEQGLALIIPEIAGQVRHQLRDSAMHNDEETTATRLARVFEHVGNGVSRTIFTHTRPDHFFAAGERRSRINGDLRWEGFHLGCAALHTDDTTTTGELPRDAVERIWKQHFGTEGLT